MIIFRLATYTMTQRTPGKSLSLESFFYFHTPWWRIAQSSCALQATENGVCIDMYDVGNVTYKDFRGFSM